MARKNEYTEQINIMIGNKIHHLRVNKGWSREQLARKIDVTHQQLQKYEKATNRITAGRLALIAEALNVPVNYFFNEADYVPIEPRARIAIEVSRNFLKIKSKAAQNAINDMVRTLSKE